MAIERVDEVLGKALESDETPIPRYDIVNGDGTTIATDAKLNLKNPVITAGTPINKVLLDQILAASGVTSNTASALYLEQVGFSLQDGAIVACRLHTDSVEGSTLTVNSTGPKTKYPYDGQRTEFTITAGTSKLTKNQ